MNASKLKMYHILHGQGKLHYGKGSIACALGQLNYQPHGLKTVGIPCVMGESPKAYVSAIAQLFVHVLAKVRRTGPSCIMALRVALSYAMPSLDFRLTLVPMTAEQLAPLQQVARGSLHLPTWFPSKYLVVPLHMGGLGYPCLELCLRLQRILLTLKAASGRSVYTRELVRGVLLDPVWESLPGSDPRDLLRECEALGLELCVNPCTDLRDAGF